jgi:iron complex transport system ATP-binding protein
MIRMRQLAIGYKDVFLNTDDIHLERGKVYALIGANGRGKTTLLKTLNGFLKPLSGELVIDNKPAEEFSHSEFARKIAFVSSKFEGVDHLTVYQYVALGRTPYLGLFGRLSIHDHSIVKSAIEQLGLTDFSERITSELSDGERQMSSIARALAQDCPVITLDEPTAFLDYKNKERIMEILQHIAKDKNKCILFSSHDIELLCRKPVSVLAITPSKTLQQIVNNDLNALIELF